MGSGIYEEEVNPLQEVGISNEFTRHDLVEISPEGRKHLSQHVWDIKSLLKVDSWPSPSARRYCKHVLEHGCNGVHLPGIVRRFTDGDMDSARELYGDCTMDDFVAVGFVIPFMPESRRIRIPCVLHRRFVSKRITPQEVARLPVVPRTPALAALSVMKERVREEIAFGVWGSGALEIYTGLPYTDGISDLDVVVARVSIDEVSRIVELADALEKSFAVRIDVEVQLKGGWGVNGRELLSGRDTILVKGIREVKLARREDLL